MDKKKNTFQLSPHGSSQGQNIGSVSGRACNYDVGATSSNLPTASNFSELDNLDIDQPPPYEELFPFMLK